MRNKKLSQITLLFLFTLTFIAFQNCEDVTFRDVNSLEKPEGPIGSDGDAASDVIQVEIEVDNSKIFLDDPSLDDVLTQDPEELADIEEDINKVDDDSASQNELDDIVDDDSEAADLVEEYVDICNEVEAKSSHAAQVLNDTSLVGFRGHAYFLSANLEAVSDIRGSLRLVANGGKKLIEKVSDIAGNILICGYDIESISNRARGNIIVVGGNIGSIENLHGNLTVIDGQILGDQKDVKGNINVR